MSYVVGIIKGDNQPLPLKVFDDYYEARKYLDRKLSDRKYDNVLLYIDEVVSADGI